MTERESNKSMIDEFKTVVAERRHYKGKCQRLEAENERLKHELRNERERK